MTGWVPSPEAPQLWNFCTAWMNLAGLEAILRKKAGLSWPSADE
ncbi:MAG: hypothetical protein ABFS86_20860 [Planctomycetota bacterium]